SGEFDYTQDSSAPAPPFANIAHPPRTYLGGMARFKLIWAPSEKHRVTLSFSSDPATLTNLGQDTYGANVLQPGAEDYQKQGGVFAIASWDYFPSQNVNTNIQTGFQYSNLSGGPEGRLTAPDFSGIAPGAYSPANYMYNPNA